MQQEHVMVQLNKMPEDWVWCSLRSCVLSVGVVMVFMECFSNHRSVIAFLQCLGQEINCKGQKHVQQICGDYVETTNAKTEKEKGPEYWHSIGKVVGRRICL